MIKKLPWLLLISITAFLCWYFLFVAKLQLGGDIVEYYGITESLKNHQGLALSTEDQEQLEQVLYPAYFSDPGYYIQGRDGRRYPVHFFFYSVLATPLRLILESINLNPLASLWLVNIFAFSLLTILVWKWYIKNPFQRIVFLIITLISPLVSFFIWPGPDLLFVAFLTIGSFAFLHKEYKKAAFFAALASWHSQPVIVITGIFLLFYVLSTQFTKKKVKIQLAPIGIAVILGLLSLIPYVYNYFAFGVLTPWSILADGWTTLRGFGLHNASLKKLFEQLFDLNIGIFWYAPVLFILGTFGSIKHLFAKNLEAYVLAFSFFITFFFYQTNPGWHYGTSGYGPGRHSLFVLAFLFVFSISAYKKMPRLLIATTMGVYLVVQSFILFQNNFLEPDLTNTLDHSPLAKTVLTTVPEWYTPTPEIFVDRTNHSDATKLESTFFMAGNKCKKAYVLSSDLPLVAQKCPNIEDIQGIVDLQDPFKRSASYQRQVILDEATFWPTSEACDSEYSGPFECPQTVELFMFATALTDSSRVSSLVDFPYPGVWKITKGDPIVITIPPGYIIDYTATEGRYIDF